MSDIPKTVEEFEALIKKNVAVAGIMWPLCKSCGHIAQAHDNHASEPLTPGRISGCSEVDTAQCKCCGQWSNKAPCSCKGYDGPNGIPELVAYLNRKDKSDV